MKPTSRQKLEALKQGVELPVDPHDLYKIPVGQVPDTDERAVLILSSTYQQAEDPQRSSVSWANQVRAAKFFNAHGLAQTLDEIVRVGGLEFLK